MAVQTEQFQTMRDNKQIKYLNRILGAAPKQRRIPGNATSWSRPVESAGGSGRSCGKFRVKLGIQLDAIGPSRHWRPVHPRSPAGSSGILTVPSRNIKHAHRLGQPASECRIAMRLCLPASGIPVDGRLQKFICQVNGNKRKSRSVGW